VPEAPFVAPPEDRAAPFGRVRPDGWASGLLAAPALAAAPGAEPDFAVAPGAEPDFAVGAEAEPDFAVGAEAEPDFADAEGRELLAAR
jgi:hypothetical protein